MRYPGAIQRNQEGFWWKWESRGTCHGAGLKATVKNVGFIPDDGKPLDSSEKGSDVNRFMFLKNLTLLTDW